MAKEVFRTPAVKQFKHRYLLQYTYPEDENWLNSADTYRFLRFAKSAARYRASVGLLKYRVVDLRDSDG